MAAKNYVALDLGAESGRAVLGTLDGGKLSLVERHRFSNPTGRMRGQLCWNLMQQWEEIKTGLRKAAAGDLRDEAKRPAIHGIGIDTWGVDFGLIGADGDVLGNPVHYRDARTDGMLEKAFAKVSKEKIFDATGIQFMQLNSLYQLLALHEQKPRVLETVDTLLFMPDLFNYLLTGVRKAEFSIATTSQMYDPRKKAWAADMLGQLGLPSRILPEIVPSGTTVGQVSRHVAEECNVGRVPVIATACHDTAAAVAAVPADPKVAPGDWCYISSGTWSLMGVELNEPVINEKSLAYNYTNEGGVGGTIRFLKNIMGLWLVQECRRQFTREGHEHSYAELAAMAGRSKGFSAIIDPDHKPFLTPGDMPAKIDQFCKDTHQPTPIKRGDYIRTCLESLALTYRRTLEGLEDILGRKISVIHIVGGGCQNELLNQMTADACKRPVVAGPVEATAAGNILVQAMGTGDVKSLADAREIVRNSFEVKRFEPQDEKKWDAAYAKFREITGK